MGTGQSVVVQQHLSKWEAALGELENISQTNRKLIEQDRIFGSSPESADAVVRRPSSLVSFGNNGNVVSGGEADNNIVSSSSIGGIGHRPRSGHQQSPGDSRQGEGRGFDSRSGTNSNQAPKHNRQQVLEVKKARVELFSSYVAKNPEALTNVMQCSHFGATAVGLSYLLGGKKDSPDRRNRVTVEDLFFAAQVPLHMLHTSPPHLPVLADIVREFLDVDNRFKDEYGVEEVHFDVSPTVGQVDLGPNEVGDRQTRMQLPEFCRVITRDCEEETSVIRIVNYDPYVLEQEMIVDAYDDDEEQQNSPLATSVLGVGPRHVQRRFSPDNDGAYAVIVDVRNAVQLMVTIAEGIVNDSLHVKMTEVPAASLFKAMMTAEEGHRARGFLRIFKKEPGTPGFGDQVNSFWSPELCSGKVLGTLAEGTHAATISHHISPHIVAVAWAIHLLKGVRNDAHGYGSGLPVSDIIRTLRFPSQVFIDGSLPLEQVFEYAKEFLSVKQLPYVATLHPVLTKISREDAVPTISVFDLESIIMDVQKSNDDVESPQHVMVLMYNACVAHNVLYIAEEPQWCVLAGYDTETQTALLIDAHPKTFSRTWTCSLERVHKAITGTGYIIFSKTGEGSENVGAPKTVSPMVLSRLQLLKEQAGMGVQSWKVQPLVKTLTFPALPVMPTIISIVCTKLLEKVITIEDVIYTVPYEVSSLLIRFFTLESLQVCLSEFLQYSGLADTVQVTSHHVERKASGGMSLLLKDFEKLVTDATVEGKALIVHFDRKRLQVHGVNHPFGSLGVVTAYNPASKIVTVMDCNPNAYLRTWSTRLDVLQFAVSSLESTDKHRPFGCVMVARGPPTCHQFPKEHSNPYHLEVLPVQNIFHVSPSPHFQGMSFAFSQLGEFYSPEEIFYEAYLKTMDDQRRRGSQAFAWRDVDVSLSVINKSIDASFMAQVCTKFLESRTAHRNSSNKHLKNAAPKETHIEVERLDDVDEEEIIELLVNGTSDPNIVLLLNYDVLKAHDLDNMGRNVALVKSFDKEARLIELWDAEYAVFGLSFCVTLEKLIEIGDIENEGKSPYGFVKFERRDGPPKRTTLGLMKAPHSQEEEDEVEAEMAAKRGINFLGVGGGAQ